MALPIFVNGGPPAINASNMNKIIDSINARGTNVKDYGAYGDGIHDDTVAIDNAIAATVANGGGNAFFPTGTYMRSTPITPPIGIVFDGQSMYSTIIKASASMPLMVQCDNNYADVRINRITFDGNNLATTIIGTSTPEYMGWRATKFYQCRFLNPIASAIRLGYVNVDGVWFYDCDINGPANGDCVVLDRCGPYVLYDGCRFAVFAGGNFLNLKSGCGIFRDCLIDVKSETFNSWITTTGYGPSDDWGGIGKKLIVENCHFESGGTAQCIPSAIPIVIGNSQIGCMYVLVVLEKNWFVPPKNIDYVIWLDYIHEYDSTRNRAYCKIKSNTFVHANNPTIAYLGLSYYVEGLEYGPNVFEDTAIPLANNNSPISGFAEWYDNGNHFLETFGMNNIPYAFKNEGIATFNGDGTTTEFTVYHGLVYATRAFITPMSADAATPYYIKTINGTILTIKYLTPPPPGTNNIKFAWIADAVVQ